MEQSRYPDSKNNDSIEEGKEYQDLVIIECLRRGIPVSTFSSKKYQLEKGEGITRQEIKLDDWCTTSDRLSIETDERIAIDRSWVKSGIYADDNSIWYIQGNQYIVFIFSKKILRLLHESLRNGQPKYERKEELTLRSFYLPFEDAKKYSDFWFEIKDTP